MRTILIILLNTFIVGVCAQPTATEKFLTEYWQRPLASQGQPPSHLSVLEQSLHPEQCGICHQRQLSGWQSSRHAQAMGAGLLGQLFIFPLHESQECLNCHAPLQEQMMNFTALPTDKLSDKNRLHEQGVLCSACHLRGYQWFGPPARTVQTASQQAYHGWQSQDAFTDSRFCAACHQFSDKGYALNGKLLENTYQEWQASPQARQQKNCQSCHMPDRQHVWRGIHDPEMVRSGVKIHVDKITVVGNFVKTSLALQNTGVGHFFPTYVTPRVILEIYQEDAQSHLIMETLQQTIIARYVSLDLGTEYFDTRLAPNETATLDYCQPLHPTAKNLVITIQVEPDAFYTRFYRSLLAGDLAKAGIPFIQQALSESEQSIFTLYNERVMIGNTEQLELESKS